MKVKKTWTKIQVVLIAICVICIKRTVDTADCDEFSWPCDKGDQCIPKSDLCDGKPNCEDGSDETINNCVHNSCNIYNFRCTYGACIEYGKRCNGQNDCADGSDELGAQCDKEKWLEDMKADCPSFEYKCRSGECIADSNFCDGHADCTDASDETLEVCAAFPCPKVSFRCGYGGCVNGNAVCDGKADCFDASDESTGKCKTSTTISTLPTPRITPAPVTTTTQVAVLQNGCRIPSDKYTLKAQNAITRTTVPLGSVVGPNTPVLFSCEGGRTLKGANNTVCKGNDVWNRNLPDCLSYCSDKHPSSGFSTKVTYELKGAITRKTSFEPGTIARISCAYFFDKPRNFRESITCRDYGWNYPKVPCDMRCGRPEDPVQKFSKGGVETNITEVPWHVGLYRRKGNGYENFCGGTLVSPRIVVSAAHCFFEAERTQFSNNDWSSYSIAAGKFYREYDREEFDMVERRNIKDVWTPRGYKGAENGFYRDISIIKLDHFMTFSDTIRPACLYIPEEANQYIRSNVQGRVSAWSQTNVRSRESTLQTLQMETVSHEKCNETLSQESFISIRGDKFCLAAYNEAFACKGDSGSGFVVRMPDGSFALFGVVSFSPTRTQECSRDHLLVLTNVLFYSSQLKSDVDADILDDIYEDSLT